MRAAVRDGLEGADRHAELAPLGHVGDGHLQRSVAHADELRADRHERAIDSAANVARERLAVVGVRAHVRSGAGRVDRRHRGHVCALGSQHARRVIVVDKHEHIRLGRADHELGLVAARDPERAVQLAAREPRQPALALLGRAGVLEQRAREHAGQERHGRERGAELLAQDRQLDPAEPLAAVLL